MISIIVPVLNEAKVLPATLKALFEQSGDFEVIVADGGSTDGSRDIVAVHKGVVLVDAPAGRAIQMNAAAMVARGDLLLFLHADTQLSPGAIAQLDAAHKAGLWRAGAFRHCFAPTDWRLRLISAVNNLRCRCTRIYFGDQAIFVSKALFNELGGYPVVPMLEDVMFCQRLRRVTRAVLSNETATTDSRRFLHHGVWRSTIRALVILGRHALGLPQVTRGFSDEVR